MLNEGLIVSAMGIGTVLIFLIILIVAMTLMHKVLLFINRICPEVANESIPTRKITTSSDEEIAIALAAVKAL